MLGQLAPIGTRDCALYLNDEMLKNAIELQLPGYMDHALDLGMTPGRSPVLGTPYHDGMISPMMSPNFCMSPNVGGMAFSLMLVECPFFLIHLLHPKATAHHLQSTVLDAALLHQLTAQLLPLIVPALLVMVQPVQPILLPAHLTRPHHQATAPHPPGTAPHHRATIPHHQAIAPHLRATVQHHQATTQHHRATVQHHHVIAPHLLHTVLRHLLIVPHPPPTAQVLLHAVLLPHSTAQLLMHIALPPLDTARPHQVMIRSQQNTAHRRHTHQAVRDCHMQVLTVLHLLIVAQHHHLIHHHLHHIPLQAQHTVLAVQIILVSARNTAQLLHSTDMPS